MDPQLPKVAFTYSRRFGIEAEINAFDRRDFKKFKLADGELPMGIEEVTELIRQTTGDVANFDKWNYTHNNDHWLVKPDSSCGIEICTPVGRGWQSLRKICQVAEALRRDSRISVDERCSLHVHVEMADSAEEIARVLAYWVKAEPVFLDSVPMKRKCNPYCQCIGMTDLFSHTTPCDPNYVIQNLGSRKYYTANCYHFQHQHRATIEFRIVENHACRDPFLIKNWTRLLLHFVECARQMPKPPPYHEGNPWSGFCWLDPSHLMRMLKFDGQAELSKGMEETKNWFLARLQQNVSEYVPPHRMFSQPTRRIAKQEIDNLTKNIAPETLASMLAMQNPDVVYSGEI